MNNYFKKALIATAVLSAFSGCAVVEQQAAKTEMTAAGDKLEARFEAAIQAPVAARIADDAGVWVNKRSVSVKEERLPAAFRSELGLTFAERSSLKDITTLISRELGMRFAFSPDVQKEAGASLLNAGFASTGDLRALLDRLTAQANMSWRYADGSVEIYRFETKVFQVAVLPGKTTVSSSVSNRNSSNGSSTGGGGSTASSSGQDSKFDLKLEFWAGVKDDIKGLVQGGTYSVSETNGTVAVTGTPQILGAVESYIKNINAMRMRQVALDVRVYKVKVTKGRDFGLSWNLVFNNLSKGIGATSALSSPVSATANFLSAVLSPSSSSPWANSSAVVNALSTMGDASVAAETSQMVLTGESVSMNNLQSRTYLSKITTTVVPNSGASTALDVDTATKGFAMTLSPNIIGGDYVQLSGAIDLALIDSILPALPNASEKTPQIFVPIRTTQSIPLKVGLRSGETYVFGLRMNENNVDSSGVGGTAVAATALGGQQKSDEARNTIIVTVTPRVVNRSN